MTKLVFLSIVALAISTATALPYNIEQVNDNDLIDAKGLTVAPAVLNNFHIRSGSVESLPDEKTVKKPCAKDKKIKPKISKVDKARKLNSGSTKVTQYSDNDIIDAKGLKVAPVILNHKRQDIIQDNDDDVVDLKDVTISPLIGNSFKRHDFTQVSDDDVVDPKYVKVTPAILNSFKRQTFEQINDDDLIDLKGLTVDGAIANILKRDAYLPEDLVEDGVYRKRASVEAAMDVLRRANYDVDLLSMSKRAVNDMYQYTDDTHTCFCAAKKSCDGPAPKPSPVHHKEPHKHKANKLVPAPSKAAHHDEHFPKASAPPPVRTPSQETPPSTPSAPISKPSPPTTPSCPAGWTHAGQGEIIKKSDNDLVDAKNLKLNINILSSGGQKTSKTVPATDKPTCTGDYCCYKTEQATTKVVQKSDNDLVDLKNLGLNVDLLNGVL